MAWALRTYLAKLGTRHPVVLSMLAADVATATEAAVPAVRTRRIMDTFMKIHALFLVGRHLYENARFIFSGDSAPRPPPGRPPAPLTYT
jgi:hypothetical protein